MPAAMAARRRSSCAAMPRATASCTDGAVSATRRTVEGPTGRVNLFAGGKSSTLARTAGGEDARESAVAHAVLGPPVLRWLDSGPAVGPRLSVEDLADLNRWFCVTRLRASAGVFA